MRRPADTTASSRVVTPFFTVNTDGSDLRLLFDEEMISHYDWLDPRYLLAFAKPNDDEFHYYEFDTQSGKRMKVGHGPEFSRDGHPSYSRDRRWILSDTYPRSVDSCRDLFLWERSSDRRIVCGRFFSPPTLRDDFRVDLHSRWSRDETRVCIDSAHEGRRAIYVIDVAALMR